MLVKLKLPEFSRSMVYRIPRYHGEHISKICPIWELLPKDVNNPPIIEGSPTAKNRLSIAQFDRFWVLSISIHCTSNA